MADTGWVDATGAGSLDITGSSIQQIVAVGARVDSITSPRVRTLSASFPRRLQYAGSYGLWVPESALTPYGGELAVIWQKTVDFEREYQYIAPLSKYGRYLWWLLPPGISMHFRVLW
jgi:hypothetical protein